MSATSASRSTPFPLVVSLMALLGAGLGLASTNPGPEEFEDFAAERLSRMVTSELCREDGLPLLARLVVRDCAGLVNSQRRVLGRLAGENTRRRNLGLLSIYRTELGGQRILPSWRLPRYTATTLAAAGQFVLLEARETAPGEGAP